MDSLAKIYPYKLQYSKLSHKKSIIKKHPIGCFLLLLYIFFFSYYYYYYYYFHFSNLTLRHISRETVRGRALKLLQNVDLINAHCIKKFVDLDLDSLWMTLRPCFQLWALITLWKVNRFEIFFLEKLELEKVYK